MEICYEKDGIKISYDSESDFYLADVNGLAIPIGSKKALESLTGNSDETLLELLQRKKRNEEGSFRKYDFFNDELHRLNGALNTARLNQERKDKDE